VSKGFTSLLQCRTHFNKSSSPILSAVWR